MMSDVHPRGLPDLGGIAEFLTSADASDRGLRSMLDAVPVEVMKFDAAHRLVQVNRAVQQGNPWIDVSTWMGRTFEQIIGETVRHFRPLDPKRNWQGWVVERLAMYDSCGTTDVRRAEGDWRRVHIVAAPDGGRFLIRVDITELKQREEMLAASERRYSELVDTLPDVVMSVLADGAIDFASQVAVDVLGREPASLRGQSLLSLVAPADRPRLGDVVERARASEAPQTLVCEVERPSDGVRRLMQFTLKRRGTADIEGGVIGVVVRDVHEQQTMALDLEREMEQLRSVFQSTGAYFLMLDHNERVVLMNQALRDLRGFGKEVVGRDYRESKHAGLDREIVARWQAASESEQLQPVEYESNTLDVHGKSHIIKITATPVQDKAGRLRYIVLIGVDDTERRQAEMRLFDASRLANLGEMASGIAHEINQPLAVIRLAAESATEELEAPETATDPMGAIDFVKGKLERIAAQTERASGIIRELRTVARKPSNQTELFDLVESARVGKDLLHEQLRAVRIELGLGLPTGSHPWAAGEASRLQQVIINLVLNARDAILGQPDRQTVGSLGHITVHVGQDSVARLGVVTVEDDGPGIPQHFLGRVFEPFFTTKPAGTGTGLGLSISHDIVRRMGGEITAENRPEGGARFRITLPLAVRPAP
jgi:PAS domain S-box-containing protein